MDKPFEGWALLELMGHRQRPGYVREVEIAGGKMLRVDIPVSKDEADQDVMVTEFYGASSIYALRPCSEEIIRAEMQRYGCDPRPVRPLEYKDRPVISSRDSRNDREDDEEEADEPSGP